MSVLMNLHGSQIYQLWTSQAFVQSLEEIILCQCTVFHTLFFSCIVFPHMYTFWLFYLRGLSVCKSYVSMRGEFLVHPSTFTGATRPNLVSTGACSGGQIRIQRGVKRLINQTNAIRSRPEEDRLAYTQSQINGI